MDIKQANILEYIQLKEAEKVIKKKLDALNKYFKEVGTDETVVDGQYLTTNITKRARLTKDETIIEGLKSDYPEFLELGRTFLDYAKNQPQLHQYIEYDESVSLLIKKANNDKSTVGATSSNRDELF